MLAGVTALLWLRRDLRVGDLPALGSAAQAGADGRVLPLFVADPVLLGQAGPVRTAALQSALADATEGYDGALVIRRGRPEEVVPALVRQLGATSVHVSAETTPYGRRRDDLVQAALPAGVPLVATGSPYAITPGAVTKADGEPYRVFTPFSRAWRDHGWPRPAQVPPGVQWCRGIDSDPWPRLPLPLPLPDLLDAGERAAHERWAAFLDDGLEHYADRRDRPDLRGTSELSMHLKFGSIHPRTLLADIAAHPAGRSRGAQVFISELCWREFYADVLWHRPDSAWTDLRPELRNLAYDDPDRDAAGVFEAWCSGRTGYPFVDAGMRQLQAEGWVHNRVRMVVASFLVKDLHVWWGHGARWFLQHLRDGDLASNSHGWQWVAGTGTDAAPYFRVFNPVAQGERFDPDGAYVRRYIPELGHLPGRAVHQPWLAPSGYDEGYPERVVDHAVERAEALRRYAEARG